MNKRLPLTGKEVKRAAVEQCGRVTVSEVSLKLSNDIAKNQD